MKQKVRFIKEYITKVYEFFFPKNFLYSKPLDKNMDI